MEVWTTRLYLGAVLKSGAGLFERSFHGLGA